MKNPIFPKLFWLDLVLSSLSFTIARSALAMSAFTNSTRIMLRELVAVCAVSFCGGLATAYIFSGRDGLQMLGIYTRAVSTKMIEMFPFWNFSFNEFVCHAVGADGLTVNPELPVPARAERRGPYPTSFGLTNFFPKSFHSCADNILLTDKQTDGGRAWA